MKLTLSDDEMSAYCTELHDADVFLGIQQGNQS